MKAGEVKETVSLENRVEAIEQTIKSLEKSTKALEQLAKEIIADKERTKKPVSEGLPLRKYIKVINLFNGLLNLSTEPLGKGRVYRFDKFGYDHKIPDNVLADIVANDEKKFKSGLCFIDDPAFVNSVGLEDAYEHILTYDEMKVAISTDNWNVLEALYDKATPVQRENIVSLLVGAAIKTGKENTVLLTQLERKADLTILEKIEDAKSLKEIIEEENKAER